MKKRAISILLTVCLLAGLLPAVTVTAHATGDLPDAHGETGSNDRPYIINEASDFSWITSNKKYYSYFLQTADIICPISPGSRWEISKGILVDTTTETAMSSAT